MSDGGLLQKAMDAQTNADDLVAAVISEPPQENSMSATKILSILVIGLLIPMLILMWFGVYIDVIPITLLSPLVILASLVFVWWKLDVGLPHIAGGSGINTTRAGVVFVTFIILVGTPTLLSLALTGDMSLGDVEFNDEGSEMSIKIRQNGGSGNHVATVSITQSDSVLWIYNVPFSIDSSDGQGDYGKIIIA